MKIIVAPDSFKECLPAEAVCAAIVRGVRRAAPKAQIDSVPMADGGEGTLSALISATNGRLKTVRARGPLGATVSAQWGLIHSGKTAIVEMAQASGLALIPPKRRNPLKTSSFGTGQILKRALDEDCREIILTLGGVATNDAGVGFAQALGYRFLDRNGREILAGAGGLDRLDRIDVSRIHPHLKRMRFIAACDVTNPLCGPRGSAAVYGPQKGATPAMIPQIERALRRFAKIVRRDLGIRVIDRPGAGAAGGAGAGAIAFLNAKLQPGVGIVIRAVGLERRMRGADLVITGEGKIDRQTFYGKVVNGVANCGRTEKIPVIAICGQSDLSERQVKALGLSGLFPIMTGRRSYSDSVRDAGRLLEAQAEAAVRNLRCRN